MYLFVRYRLASEADIAATMATVGQEYLHREFLSTARVDELRAGGAHIAVAIQLNDRALRAKYWFCGGNVLVLSTQEVLQKLTAPGSRELTIISGPHETLEDAWDSYDRYRESEG